MMALGVSETAGAAATPVPLSDTVCGEPTALSTIVKVAEREPAAVGVKVTLMVQEVPEFKVAGQLLV